MSLEKIAGVPVNKPMSLDVDKSDVTTKMNTIKGSGNQIGHEKLNKNNTKQVSEQNVTQTNQATESYYMASSSEIMEMFQKLQEIFSRLRDVNLIYNQKQQELGWDIQVSAFNSRLSGIEKAATGGTVQGIFHSTAGVLGCVGAGFSRSKEIAMALGRAGGDSMNGIGSTTQALEMQKSELDKLSSELQSTNAQTYMKNMEESKRLGEKFSSQMNGVCRELTAIYEKITSAIKIS